MIADAARDDVHVESSLRYVTFFVHLLWPIARPSA